MGGNVTLMDVAKVADVSVSTASRVLNGTGRVSEATRERILAAARRLKFQPNALARSFATGRSLTVGILARNALSTFSMPVLIGASGALGESDLATLTYDLRVGNSRFGDQLEKLRSRRVDGVLVVGDGMGVVMRSVTATFEVPVVYTFCASDVDSDVTFLPDNRGAGRMAAEHLLAQGRRRIAHITARDDPAARERERGFVETLDAAGVQLVHGEALRGDWTRTWGATAVRALLDRGERVDGLFCGDDWIALGAQAALRDADFDVPGEVTVVGFDNLGGLVDRPARSLTTIDPRLSRLGAAAVAHLVATMHGADLGSGERFQPCELVTAPGDGAGDATDELGGLGRL